MEDNCIQTAVENQEVRTRLFAFNQGQKIGFIMGCAAALAVLLIIKTALQMLGYALTFHGG
jgi:hypothetical protein